MNYSALGLVLAEVLLLANAIIWPISNPWWTSLVCLVLMGILWLGRSWAWDV